MLAGRFPLWTNIFATQTGLARAASDGLLVDARSIDSFQTTLAGILIPLSPHIDSPTLAKMQKSALDLKSLVRGGEHQRPVIKANMTVIGEGLMSVSENIYRRMANRFMMRTRLERRASRETIPTATLKAIRRDFGKPSYPILSEGHFWDGIKEDPKLLAALTKRGDFFKFWNRPAPFAQALRDIIVGDKKRDPELSMQALYFLMQGAFLVRRAIFHNQLEDLLNRNSGIFTKQSVAQLMEMQSRLPTKDAQYQYKCFWDALKLSRPELFK